MGEREALPIAADKELMAMNQLMADKQYKIKLAGNFLVPDRSDRLNPDFILYTLNDYLGHLQRCVASTRKMLPPEEQVAFYSLLSRTDPVSSRAVSLVAELDIKTLSAQILRLQADPRDATVSDLQPFVKLLFKTLLRLYYLGPSRIAQLYKGVYASIVKELVPADPDALKAHVASAIEEWYYIFNTLIPGLYPLVLRMSSPTMLGMQALFYANGSKLLAWLGLAPSEVLFVQGKVGSGDQGLAAGGDGRGEDAPPAEEDEAPLPEEVVEGLSVLEDLFPDAGWQDLAAMPDLCPYFQSILQLEDAFVQLSPANPLHQALILFWILEELFQGLRQIRFQPLSPQSFADDLEDINRVLDEWILYYESIFDKVFSADLKAFTHQIYTQPDFAKSPYGRKLLSNMYTLLKAVFLPYFDIRMHGTTRAQKDDRLAPFFKRVARLKKMLDRYYAEVESAPEGSDANPDGMVSGIQNPWAPYKFDIANPVSRRLDALCGGKHSKTRTNAALLRHTRAIMNVLDWWINDKNSPAYRESPEYLYRTVSPASPVPAFGVNSRSDVEALFIKKMKER